VRLVELVDKRKKAGRKEKEELASSDANFGKSAKDTASVVGTSVKKVEKTRTILDHADSETKQKVLECAKSIHKAYQEVQEKKKIEKESKSKPVFNVTNENIEWAKWTCNLVAGCEHSSYFNFHL
jgi:hypothetical protein